MYRKLGRTGGIGFTAARWMILGEWRAHPIRIVVAASAITIGVALGFAVHVINQSALNEFGRAVAAVNGDADLQIHSVTPRGFDETLYAKLAKLDGIADASPVVELAAGSGTGLGRITLLGLDVLRAGAVTPNLLPKVVVHNDDVSPDEAIFDANALFLSDAALHALRKHIGDRVTLEAAGRTVSFFIAGTLPATDEGQSLGVIDIAASQWRFGLLGRLQRIDLKLKEGADPARLRADIAAILPPGAALVNAQAQARRTDALSRAYRVNLDMLALMALLTGGFLVYSAGSLSVARRRPQFALLRVLGMTRRALITQVLAEGAIIGILGAMIGIGLGLVLAAAGLRLLGGDLGGGYFRGIRPALVFAPLPALVFLLLGMLAALLGSFIPARDVARAQPAVALKNMGDAIDPAVRPKALAPFALLGLGVVAALLPAIGGLPVFGYVSVGLLLAGGVASMPLLVRVLLTPLQSLAIRAPAVDLALKRLWGAPSQAAIALGGIVASTALTIAMAVMVLSFRQSVDDWLIQVLPADVYMRIDGDDGGGFPVEVQRQLALVKGVAAIRFHKTLPLSLSPDLPPIALLAEPIDRSAPQKSLPMIGVSLPVPAGATPVWLSEPAAGLYGHHPGDWMTLPITNTAKTVFVAGIWRDYGRQQGAIAIDTADYMRLTGDTARTDGWVDLMPGTSIGAVTISLREALPPALKARASFAGARDIRIRSLEIFDRSFAVTYLLEAVAVLVGLAGVAATFSAVTLARIKEFGMLRHIGVTRRQIAGQLACEGALLGAVGVVAGIALGIAISQVLIRVVNPQSFHWTMDTRLPVGLFVVVAASLIAASCATAFLAGRRALSVDAIAAVREDW